MVEPVANLNANHESEIQNLFLIKTVFLCLGGCQVDSCVVDCRLAARARALPEQWLAHSMPGMMIDGMMDKEYNWCYKINAGMLNKNLWILLVEF